MSIELFFAAMCLSAALFVGCIIFIVVWFDTFAAYLICRLRIPVYPIAVAIAQNIADYPEQWTASSKEFQHKIIGHIWTADGIPGLYIKTVRGEWKPSLIERRIIYNAVETKVHRYLQSSIDYITTQQKE